jgi:ABC-2 type transport system ATP-binding protein
MSWPTVSDISQESAISLQNVSVRYRISRERIATFKEYMILRVKRKIQVEHRGALDAVSMEIRRGETFGVIGRNGAGKSTLLKVISRILIPSGGRVVVRGQVSPLLELGAGFHMELTGLENIFLNGVLLGHSEREVGAKLEEIIEFSGLGEYLDAPLRTYSTGMVARLGFTVATAWEPDILLLDEVLSVGDEAFQEKCRMRLDSFQRSRATILVVSHNAALLQAMCTRVAWVDAGRCRMVGPAVEVIQQYHEALAGKIQ